MEIKKESPNTNENYITNETLDVQIKSLKATDWKEAYLEDHNTCCLCGTELYLTHVTNFVENQVTEEAFCEHCRIRTRKSDYNLQ